LLRIFFENMEQGHSVFVNRKQSHLLIEKRATMMIQETSAQGLGRCQPYWGLQRQGGSKWLYWHRSWGGGLGWWLCGYLGEDDQRIHGWSGPVFGLLGFPASTCGDWPGAAREAVSAKWIAGRAFSGTWSSRMVYRAS
jgi:hypothetical protein